jgi:hypothetical protein
MPALPDRLRSQLENRVIAAREVAETAARAALARLAVGEREPHAHLSPEQRQLRVRLREHGRRLGDRRSERTGEQPTDHLAAEVAYEAWHRMLFARFLAENHLLMHPAGVAVSLEECEEIAREEGVGDGWVLASRYAAAMLPQIFRPDDPLLQVPFAPEHQKELERLLADLPPEVFRADDSLGWVYQFWQSKRKDQVNASGVKIGAEELPAVTQLFTEPYMVSFLLENTIGAWWVARHPGQEPPVAMPYLRRLEDDTPAAGGFDGWPDRYAELAMLDPCTGSGHFLVAMLKLLVPLRMHDEGLTPKAAIDAVIRENLHGLELDARCTQIAAFAVALAAWTYPGAVGYRPLPELHIACSGTPVTAKKQEWLALAGGDTKLEAALERLYELFRQAPELGSLIDPKRGGRGDLLTASFEEVQPLLERVLSSEKARQDASMEVAMVAAQGVAKAGAMLSRTYTLVATNVPYLSVQKQCDVLRNFAEQNFPSSRHDLSTTFIERCLRLCSEGGSVTAVTPQNWLFLQSYRAFREQLLREDSWGFVVRLGAGAFGTITGEVVNVSLLAISRGQSVSRTMLIGDVSASPTPGGKAEQLQSLLFARTDQAAQLANPDARILSAPIGGRTLLSDFATAYLGICSGDYARFGRKFWELDKLADGWERQQSTVSVTQLCSGMEHVFWWEDGIGGYASYVASLGGRLGGSWRRGEEAWGKVGIMISQMGNLPVAAYTGTLFDNNAAALVPHRTSYLPAIWAFCSSDAYSSAIRTIDQSLKVTNSSLTAVPFDFEHWQRVAEERYPSGLPEPYSDDPTQWLFKGEISTSTEPLQVAVARLLGYRWPDQPADPKLDALADQDGIVCLPAVRGERPATDRLQEFLAAAYGKDWSPARREELLASVGFAGKKLDDWLLNGFFEQHFKLFHNRPFIWHIWDGRKDGFSALVNYHKLDRKTLETLTYTYLGDWISRQEEGKKAGTTGAEARLAAARDLQDELKLILQGEPPYDLFARWKPLHEQPIGWETDLNDGVRVNIYPFMQAGVLRKNPNIHWRKDRGKNPPDSPWGEERYNRYEDIPDREHPHLTNAIKRAARAEAAGMKRAG